MELIDKVGLHHLVEKSTALTKKFEEIVRGTIIVVTEYFEQKGTKGEFMIMVAPPDFIVKDIDE